MSLGKVVLPSEITPCKVPKSTSSDYLIRSLCKAPALSACEVPHSQILFLQLQKLGVNAVINPLTSILDCYNGELFARPGIHALAQQLIAEISSIIQPLLANAVKEADQHLVAGLSPKQLEHTILEAAAKTAENISSMRQDILAGKKTEVDYINGYIVARALESTQDCSINRKIVDMIHSKTKASEDQLIEHLLKA